ncbi:hypothetical protein TL16_g05593 [Triparma laevis f. inornata]|uniref:Uncharacterized protein n=1 Tax=Triparma laevis f. inornata TaxID=1714386 RepID=A0A9W7AKU6_9STRA|nr:hypothetical protein TL16_g05593 [Triparma laevis f. inornata]
MTVKVIQKGYYAVEGDGSTSRTRKEVQICEPGNACVGGGKRICKGVEHSSKDKSYCEPCAQYKKFNGTDCVCKKTFIEDGDECKCPPSETLVDGNCTACEDGWFKTTTGIKSCTSCDAEVIEDAFKTHPKLSKNSSESCACGVGYFRKNKIETDAKQRWICQDCEDRKIGLNEDMVNCTQIGLTLATLPVNDGYWRSSLDSHKIEKCDMDEACKRGAHYNGTTCAKGYRGPICSVCEDGFSKILGECRECIDIKIRLWFYIGGPILLIVGFLGVYFFLRKKYNAIEEITKFVADTNKKSWSRRVRSRLKIVLSFYQIISSLPDTIDIVFPSIYLVFNRLVSSGSKLDVFKVRESKYGITQYKKEASYPLPFIF